MDLESIFTSQEKAALSILCGRGFVVYTEVKVEDVKELDGTRHRTFRNQGRYDLALMLKDAQSPPPKVPELKAEPVEVVEAEAVEVSATVEAEKVEVEPEPEVKKPSKAGRKKKTVKRTFKQ